MTTKRKPPDLTMTSERPLPSLTPESLSGNVEVSSASAEPSGDHLEAALAEATGATTAAPAGPALMPRDEWCKMWLACHGIGGNIIGVRALIEAPERKGAMDAAGAIYDTAAETPALRWLLDPQGEWVKRIVVVGTFYAPLSRDVMTELRARRRPAPAAANANAAPPVDMAAPPANGLHTAAIDDR